VDRAESVVAEAERALAAHLQRPFQRAVHGLLHLPIGPVTVQVKLE
jgi:hypothetical protein